MHKKKEQTNIYSLFFVKVPKSSQWFTETIETIRTSGLTLIISTIRFFKTFTAEFGIIFGFIQ